jgi:hypothetical protein
MSIWKQHKYITYMNAISYIDLLQYDKNSKINRRKAMLTIVSYYNRKNIIIIEPGCDYMSDNYNNIIIFNEHLKSKL